MPCGTVCMRHEFPAMISTLRCLSPDRNLSTFFERTPLRTAVVILHLLAGPTLYHNFPRAWMNSSWRKLAPFTMSGPKLGKAACALLAHATPPAAPGVEGVASRNGHNLPCRRRKQCTRCSALETGCVHTARIYRTS